MPWQVEFHSEFEPEFLALERGVRIEMAAQPRFLEAVGPNLGRATVDTIKGSGIANLKELRFDAGGGVWRVLFAFDRRIAVLLVAGDKRGAQQVRFYKKLVAIAEARWKK